MQELFGSFMFLGNFSIIVSILGIVFLDNILIYVEIDDFFYFRDIFIKYDIKF